MDPNRDRYDFDEVGRLPAPGDNVAIATRRLEAGTRFSYEGSEFVVPHTVLEGHRFAVEPIPGGEDLLSWGLPFGRALGDISPGDYACNEKILRVLRERFDLPARGEDEDPEGTPDQGGGRVPGGYRKTGLDLPEEPNFRDAELEPYVLDEERFCPGEQVPLCEEPRTFTGYRRGGGRGVGTRNYVVVLGVNSRLTGFVRALEWEMNGVSDAYENVDGIVCVAHTEGGEGRRPNNLDLLLRTLSGFMVHPNVGAVLAIDGGEEGAVATGALRRYAEEYGYPLDHVPHEFMSLEGSFRADLERAKTQIMGWMDDVNAAGRTQEPLSELKIGLQCGGSDAFSGVSANPLVGWVSREVVRNGGAANLAETDELIGAERYVLKNVKDAGTARRFLRAVERFKERVSWHGHTAEDNPSGGNNFRGLYNISIKSIGAARKKDPDVRIDRVIEYAEPMGGGGFYFMDSPGNDLESVAGQVASGANVIFFTTGNGSITNFPFVPTIKVVTTTGRYDLLSKDMDVNAGAYLDGVPMDELGKEMFERTITAASDEKTVGERAGHAQVSIWRDWKQTGPEKLGALENVPEPNGEPLPVRDDAPGVEFAFEAIRTDRGPVADQIGLVMPTSLCSGQIARRIANRLNGPDAGLAGDKVTRFVALPHTEGCGVSAGSAEAIYSRTVLGYLANPTVRLALLLEHGCEKTHNDYFENRLAERGLDRDRFGWASVQLDGGIESVVEKVETWFSETLEASEDLEHETAGPGALRLGFHASGPLPDDAARSLAEVTLAVVGAGGTVVVPQTAAVLGSEAYLDAVLGDHPVKNTLAYGQAFREPGLHVMEAPTDHWVEAATGLGATGVEIMLAHVAGRPLQAHRMIPLLQISSDPETIRRHADDLDALLEGDPNGWTGRTLETVSSVASREYTPKLFAANNTDFQFTRGLLGVSM